MAVLSHLQRADLAGQLDEHGLFGCVIYRCVVGSRAYGLDDGASDYDRRGIYLPPADRQWSLYGVPEQLEHPATEELYWELQKFLVMALKANPNVLECLYTPLVETASPVATELLAMRDAFLSKRVYQSYSGYVASQFKKVQADLRNKGAVKWKHVMHLLRLLLAGIGTLLEARVPVHVGEHRERLLAVKRGEVPFEELDAWRLALHRRFDAAYEATSLPDRPGLCRGRRVAAAGAAVGAVTAGGPRSTPAVPRRTTPEPPAQLITAPRGNADGLLQKRPADPTDAHLLTRPVPGSNRGLWRPPRFPTRVEAMAYRQPPVPAGCSGRNVPVRPGSPRVRTLAAAVPV